jgi:hypothetical protein
MENPYLSKMGLFGAAGHSPNHVVLATRKVCQNDEILDRLAALTSLWHSHISPRLGQWRWRAFGCVLAIEPRIAQFPLIGRMRPGSGPGAAMRHDELIGTSVDHFTAATPNRKDRNLA